MSLPHWPPSLPLTDAIDAAPAPPALVCPITRRLMRSPALVATTGRSYEREDLVRWVRANGTDPVDVTVRVSTDELVPNLALRSSIETHAIEANGGAPLPSTTRGSVSSFVGSISPSWIRASANKAAARVRRGARWFWAPSPRRAPRRYRHYHHNKARDEALAKARANIRWPPAMHYPDELAFDPGAPPEIVCPITQCPMSEPAVCAASGRTYERRALERWVDERSTEPSDRSCAVSRDDIAPNLAVRRLAYEWAKSRVPDADLCPRRRGTATSRARKKVRARALAMWERSGARAVVENLFARLVWAIARRFIAREVRERWNL